MTSWKKVFHLTTATSSYIFGLICSTENRLQSLHWPPSKSADVSTSCSNIPIPHSKLALPHRLCEYSSSSRSQLWIEVSFSLICLSANFLACSAEFISWLFCPLALQYSDLLSTFSCILCLCFPLILSHGVHKHMPCNSNNLAACLKSTLWLNVHKINPAISFPSPLCHVFSCLSLLPSELHFSIQDQDSVFVF